VGHRDIDFLPTGPASQPSARDRCHRAWTTSILRMCIRCIHFITKLLIPLLVGSVHSLILPYDKHGTSHARHRRTTLRRTPPWAPGTYPRSNHSDLPIHILLRPALSSGRSSQRRILQHSSAYSRLSSLAEQQYSAPVNRHMSSDTRRGNHGHQPILPKKQKKKTPDNLPGVLFRRTRACTSPTTAICAHAVGFLAIRVVVARHTIFTTAGVAEQIIRPPAPRSGHAGEPAVVS